MNSCCILFLYFPRKKLLSFPHRTQSSDMAKRFRLRISRLLHSCRSTEDPTSLPSDPIPSFLRHLPRVDHRCSSLNCRLPSSFIPCGCGCGCGSRSPGVSLSGTVPHEFHWKQETDFHAVVAATAAAPRLKIYSSSVSKAGDGNALAPPLERRKRRTRSRKRKPASLRQRVNTSSGDSGLFSSEDVDRREEDRNDGAADMLLISSSEKSSDCILKEIDAAERKKATKRKKHGRRRKGKAGRKNNTVEPQPAISSPARLSAVFRRLASPCGGGAGLMLEGPPAAKVRESFAVVKRSECPYEDFKGSMMEMIVEKEMFEEEDLEQLLICFLSLNSSCHHSTIVTVFAEICEALFGCRRSSVVAAFPPDVL